MSVSLESTENLGANQPETIRTIVYWLVSGATIAVLIYSFSVLSLVAFSGDLGLRFVLGTVVRDTIATDDYQWLPESPELGSTITRIGPTQIRSYPELVQVLRELNVGERLSVGYIRPDGRSSESQVLIRQRPFWTYASSIVWFVQELFIFAVGARVFWKRPRDTSAGIFFLICVLTFGAFMGGYHWTEIAISRPLIHVFTACAVFLPWANLHFYQVFPAESLIYARNRRWITRIIYAVPATEFLLLAFCMNWVRYSRFLSIDDSILAVACLRWVALASVAISSGVNGLCVISIYKSYKRATTKSQKGQIQWIFLASVLSLPLICLVLYRALQDTSVLGRGGAAWPMFIVSLLFTTAYAFSITRYRLLQADRLLGRGVLYLAVSVGAGLVYSLLLVLGGLIIGDRLRSGESSFEIVAAAGTALVLLVASGALREQFHKVIDRRFYREKYKFDRAMRQIEVAFENLLDRVALSRRLLKATMEVIHSDWGAIYLLDIPQGTIKLQASEGPEPEVRELPSGNALIAYLNSRAGLHLDEVSDSSNGLMESAKDVMISLGAELAVGLESAGRLEGFMILGPKPSGLPYDAEEMAFVRALGSVAGLGLQSVQMRTTLEQANRELKDKVEKIAEQQRRILVLQDQLSQKGVTFDRSGSDLDAFDNEPEADNQWVNPSESSTINDAFSAIMGSSQSLRNCILQARKVADTSSAVLIRGESGTGKELLAQAIHRSSQRADKPFVAVHCASLSTSLLESELFGHVKGAFTGADRDRPGRFEQSDGGTIFLDEIGDISLEIQIKLLRFLQEKTFERVGSSQSMKVDVRVIAATHRDLESMIRQGLFREDLYYRLNVISLRTPALRERKEDVFALAIHFLNVFVNKLQKPVSKFANEAVEQLVAYDWPGNIRELENCIERAIVLTEGDTIRPEDLPSEILSSGSRTTPNSKNRGNLQKLNTKPFRVSDSSLSDLAVNSSGVSATTVKSARKLNQLQARKVLHEIEAEAYEYERVQLLDALREAGGNRSQAARLLGLPRTTMISRMKRHGLM
jgi:transcriptional regulator with GAF, ATPase, and Fis domain